MSKLREFTEDEVFHVEEAFREYLWELSREDLNGMIEWLSGLVKTKDKVACLSDDETAIPGYLEFDPFDHWVILGEADPTDQEPLYWSNEIGWVSINDATYVLPEEKQRMRLPNGRCGWVRPPVWES